MGYTHFYKVEDWSNPEWQIAWPQLIEDTSTIVNAVPDIPLTGPAIVTFEAGEDIPNPPTVDINEGMCINGVDDDPYEDFVLKESEPDTFCKTGRLAYDLVVTCVLLRAYRLAPNTFHSRMMRKNELRHERCIMTYGPNDADKKPAELDEIQKENE